MKAVVLYLNPVAEIGGAELSLLELAARLDPSRFAPVIACLGHGPLVEAAARAGVPVHSIAVTPALTRASLRGRRSGLARLAGAMVAALPVARRLRALVRALRPAAIHSNGNKTHVLALLAARGDAEVIWHVRDFLPDRALERCLIRLGNRRCAAIIANSAAVGRHLATLGADRARLRVIPNGIDVARFSPEGTAADLRGVFGWPPRAPVIGIVGVLARWKGQPEFLRALREIRARGRDVRGLILGEEIYGTDGHGTFQDELRTLVRDLKLDDAVGFSGRRADIPDVLRALDVVVHASITPEPFGRVVAEAMACGRPLVATRGGGVDEIVGERAGAHVTTVAPGDPAALAEAIVRVLDAPPDAEAVRANHARMRDRFGLDRHVRAVEALYDELISSRRPAVVHVGKFYPPARGGMETVLQHVCAGTAGRWRVRALVAGERARTTRETIDGVEVVRTARVMQLGALPVCPGLPFALWRVRDACVVVHDPHPLAMLALALRRPARPMVVWHHADLLRPRWARPLYTRLRRRVMRRAACVIVSNPTIARAPYLRDARRIVTIPFGIDLAPFLDPTPAVVARARAIKDAHSRGLVLFVGRLVYYKGVDVLLRAIAACDAALVVAGAGPEERALRALARALAIDDRVSFVGDVATDALPAYYRAADVFVLPSTHATEAFGIVQVEAMASGVPIVSTDLPTGVPWVNQHDVTGFVVPPGDDTALAAALTRLLAGPTLRRALGDAGRRRAIEEFSADRMIARFEVVLREVCGTGLDGRVVVLSRPAPPMSSSSPS